MKKKKADTNIPKKFDKLLEKTIHEWRTSSMADTKVDKYDLDEACATQGQVMVNYTYLCALSHDYKKCVERILSEVEAVVQLRIREKPEKYGLEEDKDGKLREQAVKSALTLSSKVSKWRNKLSEAETLYKFMDGAVKAVEHRRTMIRMLGDLYLDDRNAGLVIKESTHSRFRDKMKNVNNDSD